LLKGKDGYFGAVLDFTSSLLSLDFVKFEHYCVGLIDQDKWRNMSVMPNALGAREKSRVTLKRVPVQPVPVKQEEVTTSVSDVPQSDEEMPDVKPVASSSAPNPPLQIAAAPKRSIVRLAVFIDLRHLCQV